MGKIKLFIELPLGALFHFYCRAKRILIKSDRNHYIAPEGRRVIHPHVGVFQDEFKEELGGPSIYERFYQGAENNGRGTDDEKGKSSS